MAIQISGCPVIDNSRNLTNIANATSSAATANTYVIRDANGKICVNGILGMVLLCSLGSEVEGGRLICKSGGTAWIVAPVSTEVSRNWYCRNDAVTTANANAACGDWFVPTITQLQNPGYTCRTYWDSFFATFYFSSTEVNASHACIVAFNNGNAYNFFKPNTHCVRAFRCVTY